MTVTAKTSQVFVFDDLHPEDNAMLQALYSRSPSSVLSHLEKVKEAGSGKFMERFYVGYGHASIGDCGSTTVFIENVSMLVAKAVQDHPLYSGQEASTRYLDFSVQPIFDPYDHPASAALQKKWMDIYNRFLPVVQKALAVVYPFSPEDYKNEKIWQNAINARSFDMLRCLLPLGTTTLVSWHTNLRQARDRLRQLKNHPLPEVRAVAGQVFEGLYARYANSFNGEEMRDDSDRYGARNAYAQTLSLQDNFADPAFLLNRLSPAERAQIEKGDLVASLALMDVDGVNRAEAQAFRTRPQGASLPRRLESYGVYNFYFLLDFGSFRDIQRHRNGYCPIPLVGNRFGFHRWYLDELKAVLSLSDYTALKGEIDAQISAIESLSGVERDPLKDQYLYPMGMACLCQTTYSLPQTVYVAELRAGKTVHPSLRPVAQQMGRALERRHPDLSLYIDYDTDSWTAKRGEQDIAEKKAAS